MKRAEIFAYFGRQQPSFLEAFRALCNTLKGSTLRLAVQLRHSHETNPEQETRSSARGRGGALKGSCTAASRGQRTAISSKQSRAAAAAEDVVAQNLHTVSPEDQPSATDRAARGRLDVLDLGCGKGGDLWKWSSHRLRSYHGLDGSEKCIEEARQRYSKILATGRSLLPASFECRDLCCDGFGIGSQSIDIATAQFFVQYCFETEATCTHFFSEVVRVLRVGGILVGIVPDGDRIHHLFASQKHRSTLSFGHFLLTRYSEGKEGVDRLSENQLSDEPFGVPYRFSLTDGGCTEYVVSPALLDIKLYQLGMEPCGGESSMSMPAHQFWERFADPETISQIMQRRRCSHTDWVSLALFRVVLARKKSMDVADYKSHAESSASSSGPSVSAQALI